MDCTRRQLAGAHAALLLAGLALGAAGVGGQEPVRYTISGTVLDAVSRAPLAGVSVLVRGTQLGALTDAQGRYTLTAGLPPGTYTLEYTLIGRATETRPLTLAGERAVRLEPVLLRERAVTLAEIVVSAPGVAAERRALPSTISTVSGEEVAGAPAAASIDVALQGKIPGALITETSGQPGGGTTIRLRGPNSILGTAEPLIVVDGVIVDNDTEALLSLGANAGRGGASLTNRLADLAPADVERVEVLKGAAAAALYGSRAKNGVIQIFTRRGGQGRTRVQVSTETETSEAPKRYALNMAPTAGYADWLIRSAIGRPDLRIGDPVARYDIQDQIFRRGWGNATTVSVSGGGEATSFYVSASTRAEQGIVRPTDYRKVSARARLTQQLGDRIEITAGGNFVQTDTRLVPEGEQTQGALTSVVFTPTVWNPAFDPTAGRYPYNPILGPNPLDVIENWRAEEDVVRFVGSVDAVFRPRDNLSVRYIFGLDDYRQEDTYLRPPASEGPTFPGEVNNPVRFSRQYNHDLVVTHSAGLRTAVLNSSLGFRATKDRAEVIGATVRDLPPEARGLTGATPFVSQSIAEFHTVGGFLQEQLGIGGALFLTGGLNVEASSAFGPDERWRYFPRFGVSWLPVQDRAEGTLSTLRLRAAFGETGGQPPQLYDRYLNTANVAFGGRPGLVPSTRAGNPGLKPERQRELEAGVELGLLGDRLVLELTGYHQRTFDLILDVPQPPSAGVLSRPENIGELRNRGIEGALSTVNVSRPGLSWRSRLTFAANRNRVERLVTAADTLVFGYLNAVIEGQPLGVFYGGRYMRDAQGRILLLPYKNPAFPGQVFMVPARDSTVLRPDSTGALRTIARNSILGDPNPDFVASLLNTLTLGRHLEVSVLLDGRFGNDVANFTRRITEFFGADKRVEEEIRGDTVPFTRARNPYGRIQVYEEYIEDGSFVKLRELAVRYRATEGWLPRLFRAQAVDLRLAGRNLVTWTGYSGLDPEINLFAANTVAQGVDFANTPIPRSLTLGVTLTY